MSPLAAHTHILKYYGVIYITVTKRALSKIRVYSLHTVILQYRNVVQGGEDS